MIVPIMVSLPTNNLSLLYGTVEDGRDGFSTGAELKAINHQSKYYTG
jgi:hypothetical protein